MGVMMIVNAPLVFAGAYKIASGFLDEKTKAKIKIYGKNKYQKDLLQLVE